MVVGQTGASHRRVPRKSRGTLVAAKGAGAPDVRHPVAASRLRIFSLVSRQPPLECRARRSAPFDSDSDSTRLESNPPSSTRALCFRPTPWIPFWRGGSRDFEREVIRLYLAIMREKRWNGWAAVDPVRGVSRGGEGDRMGVDACVYIYIMLVRLHRIRFPGTRG